MRIDEIVSKLIGSVEPCGDSEIDEGRFNNLKEHISLTNSLIKNLIEVAEHKNSYEFSRKKLGEYAYNELLEIKEMLEREEI